MIDRDKTDTTEVIIVGGILFTLCIISIFLALFIL